MNNPKSPTLKEKDLPEGAPSTTIENVKKLRTIQLLLAGSLAALTGAIGLLILSQYTFFSALLGFVSFLFFGSRQLVKKSLALTENSNELESRTTQYELEQIKKQVSKCKFLESVEAEGVQASDQAEHLLHQYKNLKSILSQKFESSELTFSRYLGSIEESCLSIGENLSHTKRILENLNMTSKNPTEQWKEQRNQANNLLKATDEALQELAILFNSINEITTKEKHRDQLEQSMLQIKELANRAKIYSKH